MYIYIHLILIYEHGSETWIPISSRSTLILCSPLRVGLPKGLFPVGLPVEILKACLPSSILATCPAHLNLLDLINPDYIR